VAIHATSTQTSIPAGSYNAELVITSPTNVATSLIKGSIVVSTKVA
jgi:hypothetical protein